MADFDLRADASALDNLFELPNYDELFRQATKRWAEKVRDHAAQIAKQRLHARLPLFLKALTVEEVEGRYAVVLDGSASWIDDGSPPRDMLDALLNSPKAKTSKSGDKYIVIPMRRPGAPPASLGEALRGEAGPQDRPLATDGEVEFRVASSKQSGMWRHPGLSATNIIEDAHRWGEDYWNRVVFPEFLEQLLG